jgi:hypothetical protein
MHSAAVVTAPVQAELIAAATIKPTLDDHISTTDAAKLAARVTASGRIIHMVNNDGCSRPPSAARRPTG